MKARRVLVTGANGFVGRPLCVELQACGYEVRAAVRRPIDDWDIEQSIVDIGPNTNWEPILKDVDDVVHLAARVHVTREDSSSALRQYRLTNVEGSERMAREAARLGVTRFVYVSSIKVNGESTHGTPFSETDVPDPKDAYGRSKWEAEQAITAAANETGLKIVILRPPLVYGPGVKANFLELLSMVNRGVPLPFGGISNSRSLIYVGNLVDLIIKSLVTPRSAGQTYLLADDEALSTPELVSRMANALGCKPPRLLRLPPKFLWGVGVVTGRQESVRKITSSLTVDSLLVRSQLGWVPPFSVDEGLAATAQWFKHKYAQRRA